MRHRGKCYAYFETGSLQLEVISEPAATLFGGLGMLLMLRRRRSWARTHFLLVLVGHSQHPVWGGVAPVTAWPE
jgi:hypothetical protein